MSSAQPIFCLPIEPCPTPSTRSTDADRLLLRLPRNSFASALRVADEIRFACPCATLVVLRQSLTVAPRNLNAYNFLIP